MTLALVLVAHFFVATDLQQGRRSVDRSLFGPRAAQRSKHLYYSVPPLFVLIFYPGVDSRPSIVAGGSALDNSNQWNGAKCAAACKVRSHLR